MESTDKESNAPMGQRKQLSSIFIDGWDTLDTLEEHPDPNSVEYRKLVARGRECFELCTCLVNQIDLFSSNEMVEEISTDSLKYMLLPFFLGKITLKRNSTPEERGNILELAEIYYKDFLQRCDNCGITDGLSTSKDQHTREAAENVSGSEDHEPRNVASSNPKEQLVAAAIARNDKIRRYQHKKELDKFIQKMKTSIRCGANIENGKGDDLDDEVIRDFYLKLLQSSLMSTREELDFLKMEKEMLAMRLRMQKAAEEEGQSAAPSKPIRNSPQHARPFQPFIIARNEVQKSVFGLGYPSVPVMTVDDFYNQRVQEGIFPSAAKAAEMNKERAMAALRDPDEQEEEEKAALDKQIEEDNPQYLERMRRMDEHRDVVRRGDGNRYNRS